MNVMELVGIVMLMGAVAASRRGGEPAEREVVFGGSGGIRLAGSLMLPTRKTKDQRSPAVLLVAGSGPTDRDGNQGSAFRTDLLKQLAASLAEHGIASLRYDKRAIGASAKPASGAALAEFVSWRNYAADVVAAYRWLQRENEFDPGRIAMVGHSEGGLLVLDAAQATRQSSKPPAALVLVSTPGRPIDAVIRDQLTALLKLQHATDEQTRFFLGKSASVTEAIRATGKTPIDVPADLAALYPYYIGPFFQGELKVDPAALAATFAGPVLVVQGTEDRQVSRHDDAPLLDRALASRTPDDHRFVLIAHASHNLKRVRSESDQGLTGPVVREALDAITAWLRQRLQVSD